MPQWLLFVLLRETDYGSEEGALSTAAMIALTRSGESNDLAA
jgi:hypothetical protein